MVHAPLRLFRRQDIHEWTPTKRRMSPAPRYRPRGLLYGALLRGSFTGLFYGALLRGYFERANGRNLFRVSRYAIKAAARQTGCGHAVMGARPTFPANGLIYDGTHARAHTLVHRRAHTIMRQEELI